MIKAASQIRSQNGRKTRVATAVTG